MNEQERAAARALHDEALWLADQEYAEFGRGIPLSDFDGTLGPAVNRLQAFFPNNRLPAPAQALWREIQGLTDLSLRDKPSTDPNDFVRLNNALDGLIEWLRKRYRLTESTSQTAEDVTDPVNPPSQKKVQLSDEYLYRMVLQLELLHLDPKQKDPNRPRKLRELHKGNEGISTVRRGLLKLFPKGIKEHYWRLCRNLSAMQEHLDIYKRELEHKLNLRLPT